MFNIVIFGTGAAIYLFAVDPVMNTATIPGWLQVVLVFLTGLVGWLLLRPYRRITQLGGKDPLAAIAAGGVFNRRQAQIEQTAAAAAVAARPDGGAVPGVADRPPVRVELRAEQPLQITGTEPGLTTPTTTPPDIPRRRIPAPADSWSESGIDEPSYALYRPSHSPVSSAVAESAGRTRVEARAEP